MNNSILNISGARRLPVIYQAEGGECGLACLAMIACYFGYDTDLASLRQKYQLSLRGLNLKMLIEIAASMRMACRALRCDLPELKDMRRPAILHWGGNHFVVLKSVSRRNIVVHDPALGVRKIDMAEVARLFTGISIEVSPANDFTPSRDRTRLKISSLFRWSPALTSGILQAAVLSFVVEAAILVSPLYFQIVVDGVLLNGDAPLLLILFVSFSTIMIFNVAAVLFRTLTFQYVSSIISFDMQSNLFGHLIRLPLAWFHKRRVGDIQSRFRAIRPIQEFITSGALIAIFDGVLGSAIFGIMAYYSVLLTAIVLATLIVYIAIRVAALETSRLVAGEYLVSEAREQSKFLETLRAIQTIKAAAAEDLRENIQQNAMAKTINAGIRATNVNAMFESIRQSIAGFADLFVVFAGAKLILGGHFTLGMLTAFLAFKGQALSRCTALVDQVIAWRLLDVQLDRLGDIALNRRELPAVESGIDARIDGALSCRDVWFRYGPGEESVLKGITFDIEPGEFVAISGPSGSGKTTLLKILAGFYLPDAGQIFVDGRQLNNWNQKSVRQQIGFVSQDDQLLAGSVASNISFFEEFIDMEWLIECAKMANIHREIVSTHMGYQTLAGDMGSSFSGGQIQRIILARALYKRPRILILDEGTAHLDSDNETIVNEAIAKLSITRVIVAHRQETIRAATRIIKLVP